MPITYEEFIQGRQAGKISAGIDNSVALKLIDYLPRRFQAAHIFWCWVWMLSIPAAICVSIFWVWWAGLLLLFFGTPTISTAIKRAAAGFVLEHATEDKAFFEKLVKHDLLVFRKHA